MVIWSVVAIGIAGLLYFKIQDYRMAHHQDESKD